MEFLRERVYTALNAGELRAGDKVIVGDTIMELREFIEEKAGAMKCYALIKEILPENREKRFALDDNMRYALAYLVERKENCTNCGASPCGYRANHDIEDNKINKCPLWFQLKTEQKAEKHYRPFKGTDELIKVWGEKCPAHNHRERGLTMPLIWVRNKSDRKVWLINEFDKRILDYLFTNCEFLDGSPCGVEE